MQKNPKSSQSPSKVGAPFQLVLLNDDVNTFEFVIDNLVAYCDHNPLQAEQCAWIVHNNGQCIIKKGGKELILDCASKLAQAGLSIEVTETDE